MPTKRLTLRALIGAVIMAWGATVQVAWAKLPIARIAAHVNSDDGVIVGTIEVIHDGSVRVIDPLASLPMPTDDLHAQRTWPGLAERGSMHIVKLDESKWSFSTVLPRRFGALGAVPGHGVFANGAWYPQPVTVDGDGEFVWSVKVSLDQGAVGAVGDQAGVGDISWTGVGDRVSLAVLKKGHLSLVDRQGIKLTLLTRRSPRRALRLRAARVLEQARPPEQPLSGVLVEAPLRRRIARPGVQQVYVSDRAWRLTPGARSVHDVPITRAMLQSFLRVPGLFEREVAGAALAAHYAANRNSTDAESLRWLSWNPVIHAVLNDKRLPFWGDIFNASVPQDPVKDDLGEMLSAHTPATVVVAQATDRWGENAAWTLGSSLAAGADLREAADDAEIDADWLEAMQRPIAAQDYRLDVDRKNHSVRVKRHTTLEISPSEQVVVRIDGEDTIWTTSEGSDTFSHQTAAGPKSVRVDPARHTEQSSRRGDNWPGKPSITVAAWVNQFNPTSGWIDGFAMFTARGSNDTHNLLYGGAVVDDANLPQLYLSWLHKAGPLQDGLSRPHRMQVWLEPAWTNPRFFDGTVFSVGGGAGYAHDTRAGQIFPLRGHRISVSTQAGVVPKTSETWTSAQTSVSVVAAPHPRVAFAGRAHAAIAAGQAEARLLWLGGSRAMRSLAPRAAVGRSLLLGEGEVRVLPLRGASIPMGLWYLSDVQLSLGAEAASLRTLDKTSAVALGLTGGVGVVVDLLGARPSYLALRAAVPVYVSGIDVTDTELDDGWNALSGRRLQAGVRFDQAF